MSMLNRIAVAASIADFAVKKFFFDLLKIDTVAATGSLISDAAVLSYGRNVVTAANGTKAVRLPKSTVDSKVEIVNTVADQALIVFPELAGDQINAITAGAALTVPGGSNTSFYCDASGHWYAATTTAASSIVNATAATLTVTEAAHNNKTIVLDRAAGIAVTLPAAAAGLKFKFIVKTTFTSAATIKSVAGADIMIGHAIMGNDTDNSVVNWPAVAGSTYDTIDLLGTGNSTGGLAGQVIEIEGLAANLWFVKIIGDAAGTEATPFANTVA